MNWICIGLLAGSLVTSLHDNKEACEGRAVTLREAKAAAKCVEMPKQGFSISSSGVVMFGCSTVHLDGTPAC